MGNAVTLHSTCAYGDLSEVRRLLKTATAAELEAVDDSGKTPLLVAVARVGRRDGEDDDDFDPFGSFSEDESSDDEGVAAGTEEHRETQETAGHGTSEETSIVSEKATELTDDAELDSLSKEAEIVHLLLQKHVNVDHRDENNWTALHHACYVQNAVAAKMLIHAGARPMRESFGLLPQDLLQRSHFSEWVAQAQELKDTLDQITAKSAYAIKLLAFRPSGIVQLDMGGQVEKGSLVTLEYDVPVNHSVKDYIQVLISEEDSAEITTGSYHYVPAGAHGQLTISTQDIPSCSTVRFVYVKSDINTMSREVVASGCNAVVQASVGEIFQYELFLYERVVEVESIPEFEFVDQPLIVLKRVGIVVGDEIDWCTIRPDNHIVAVNDIRIDAMDFSGAVHVLQENNGRKCTKLLMQNYSACGDFIPEKILGVGVVGKYASLHPLEEADQDATEDPEQTVEQWVSGSNSGEGVEDSEGSFDPARTLSVDLPESLMASAPIKTTPQTEIVSPAPLRAPESTAEADERREASKFEVYSAEDPATMDRDQEEKISASSTIETVVPLHNSQQLVAQLRHGISIGHASG